MDNKKNQPDRKVIPFATTSEWNYTKAEHYLQRNNIEEARKYSKQAMHLSPDDPKILTQYASIALLEELDPDGLEEVEEVLLRSLALDNQNADTAFYLADFYIAMGQIYEAKAYAEQCLSLDPPLDLQEACTDLLSFIEDKELFFSDEERGEWEAMVVQERARDLMEEGKFSKAIRLLENLLAKYPNTWSAYNNAALAYFYLGQSKRAKDLLRQVLEKNKGNLHALCNLLVFAYYEKNEEQVAELIAKLKKIQPYVVEHRYKLGATFALVGQNKEAYHWLRNLQKVGYEGDAGYYFWLAQAAYFSGHEKTARKAYAQLLKIDPTKEGFEPWHHIEELVDFAQIENDRTFIVEKLQNTYRSERIFGYYLLSKTSHRQELLSHPTYIVSEDLTEIEKVFLVPLLDEETREKLPKPHRHALAITDELYSHYQPLTVEGTHLFQMWFALCEKGLEKEYAFQNIKGLAAAADYMFRSARYEKITKKELAEKYEISVPTLTKYVNELIEFLPHFDS